MTGGISSPAATLRVFQARRGQPGNMTRPTQVMPLLLPPLDNKKNYPDKTSLYGAVWYPTYPDHVTLGYSLPTTLAGTSSQTPWGYADCSPTLRLANTNGDNAIDDSPYRGRVLHRPGQPAVRGNHSGLLWWRRFRHCLGRQLRGPPVQSWRFRLHKDNKRRGRLMGVGEMSPPRR